MKTRIRYTDGREVDLDERVAKLLVYRKRAVYVTADLQPTPVAAPIAMTQDAPAVAPVEAPRRTYQRRDMTAAPVTKQATKRATKSTTKQATKRVTRPSGG